MKEERFHDPGCLSRILSGIITGDSVPPPTVRLQPLVKSFRQDILYAVTKWQGKATQAGSLITPEGFPRKSNKANFASHLQKDAQLVEKLPQHSATVIDGMSLVQKINIGTNQTTFSQVASLLLSIVLREGSESKRIDVVFDTYQENSIKDAERRMLGEDLSFQVASITASQIVRQWRKFLALVRASSYFWQKNRRDNNTERNLMERPCR